MRFKRSLRPGYLSRSRFYLALIVLLLVTCQVLSQTFPGLSVKLMVSRGSPVYTWITHGLIHQDITHLTINIICVIVFGDMLSQALKKPAYVWIIFFTGIVLSGLLSGQIKNYHELGASGGTYALIGAVFCCSLRYSLSSRYRTADPNYLRLRNFIFLLMVNFFVSIYFQRNVGVTSHIYGILTGFSAALCAEIRLSISVMAEYLSDISEIGVSTGQGGYGTIRRVKVTITRPCCPVVLRHRYGGIRGRNSLEDELTSGEYSEKRPALRYIR